MWSQRFVRCSSNPGLDTHNSDGGGVKTFPEEMIEPCNRTRGQFCELSSKNRWLFAALIELLSTLMAAKCASANPL